MQRHLLTTSIVFGVVLSGCANEDDSGGRQPDVTITATSPRPTASGSTLASTPPTLPRPTAPGSTVPSTEPLPAPTGVTKTSDVVYMRVGGVDLLVDVYAPIERGPWPTVVTFHGRSSVGKDAEDMVAIAEEAAERGAVVFVPTWMAGEWFPITIDSIDMIQQAGSCAVAFAQQNAADHGGNPDLVALYGFSAGTGPAQRAALDPSDAPIPGCSTDAVPGSVSGVVLGDGEYFWHSENFDTVFREHPEAMQDAIAGMIDPARWPTDLATRFRLWSAADGTGPRALGDPGGEDDWLAARDPGGSIRRDLEELGQLADGVVSYLDSARLFELRLASAGLDVTLDEYPGGHTSMDKVDDIVDALTGTIVDPEVPPRA